MKTNKILNIIVNKPINIGIERTRRTIKESESNLKKSY